MGKRNSKLNKLLSDYIIIVYHGACYPGALYLGLPVIAFFSTIVVLFSARFIDRKLFIYPGMPLIQYTTYPVGNMVLP